MYQFLLATAILCFSFNAWSQLADKIYWGDTLISVSLDDIASNARPGEVYVLSELHGHIPHHEKQVQFIQALKNKGFTVNVGIEHFDYTQQSLLDKYVSGEMSEKDFIDKIGWTEKQLSFWREQIILPQTTGGKTLAINAPRWLTGKVAQNGLSSLSTAEQSLLPPDLQRGNSDYFERFNKIVGGGHIPPEKIENYFWAQSIWDDTMAWKTIDYMSTHNNEIMVILVGDFHVSYGGGLPDRLRARGHQSIIPISQVSITGQSPEELRELMSPHPKYGPRATLVWTSK